MMPEHSESIRTKAAEPSGVVSPAAGAGSESVMSILVKLALFAGLPLLVIYAVKLLAL